jgi:hypothetical protein
MEEMDRLCGRIGHGPPLTRLRLTCELDVFDAVGAVGTNRNADEVAQQVASLNDRHAQRLQAIRQQLSGLTSVPSVHVTFVLHPKWVDRQELLRLWLSLLPARVPVYLRLEAASARLRDVDWTVLASAVQHLTIFKLYVCNGCPPELATAAFSPALTSLIVSGGCEHIPWTPLEGCTLEHLILSEASMSVCQTILNMVQAPLKTRDLTVASFDPSITLAVPASAVDSSTMVALHDWYQPTTFPLAAQITRIAGATPHPPAKQPPVAADSTATPPSLLNIPARVLEAYGLSIYPPLFDHTEVVILNSDCEVPSSSENRAVQIVCSHSAVGQGRPIAAMMNGGVLFRAFPNACLATLSLEFGIVWHGRRSSVNPPPILLLNPTSPLSVDHYGCLVRFHSHLYRTRCRKPIYQDDALPLLELHVATCMLDLLLPDSVSSCVLRACVVAHYGAMADSSEVRILKALGFIIQPWTRWSALDKHDNC